jgi:hypothetical protein
MFGQQTKRLQKASKCSLDTRVITMFAPQDASEVTPGVLLRAEGESDERYAERSVLMDKLSAIPDAE